MLMDRRTLLRSAAAGAAGALLPSWPVWAAASESKAGPRRVVFFLQNHGFEPNHATPKEVKGIDRHRLDKPEEVALASLTLPEHIDPLAPYKDRLTILQGMNGKHVSPEHGGQYGALGGFRKSRTVPLGETIDCALSRVLPSVLPLLVFGWEDLKGMQSCPISYASSAWGPNKAVPMYCNPLLAYQNVFGAAKPGKDRMDFEAETGLYDFVKGDAARMDTGLSGAERDKFHPYLEGFEEAGERRRKLLAMAPVLERHAPAISDKFTNPKFETDWWDASLSVAIGALTSGVTNVVTISSGLCQAKSSWFGWGCTISDHNLGHVPTSHPDWLKVRRANMDMLVRIMKALEAVPEGKGTMMDNTLIVYTSCAAENQHSIGVQWPFLLLGNLGGKLKTGRYVQYPMAPKPQSRTINALYATLLHAAGAPRDQFNLTGGLKDLDRPGPLPELLA